MHPTKSNVETEISRWRSDEKYLRGPASWLGWSWEEYVKYVMDEKIPARKLNPPH